MGKLILSGKPPTGNLDKFQKDYLNVFLFNLDASVYVYFYLSNDVLLENHNTLHVKYYTKTDDNTIESCYKNVDRFLQNNKMCNSVHKNVFSQSDYNYKETIIYFHFNPKAPAPLSLDIIEKLILTVSLGLEGKITVDPDFVFNYEYILQ